MICDYLCCITTSIAIKKKCYKKSTFFFLGDRVFPISYEVILNAITIFYELDNFAIFNFPSFLSRFFF